MSYEVDLKIQRVLSENQKPPVGYLKSVNWLKTERNPKICAEVERRLLGRPLSKKQRNKIIAKIEYFKITHIAKAQELSKKPTTLEEKVDYYFQLYMNKKIDVKTFGQKVQELKLEEIRCKNL